MNWIWLNEEKYPMFSRSYPNRDTPQEKRPGCSYCVAEFLKEYTFDKKVKELRFNVSADIFYHLFINDEFIGIGPAASGGDFLCTGCAPVHYSNFYIVPAEGKNIVIRAFVRNLPDVLTDYGRGHGGFALDGKAVFEDGTSAPIVTDEGWLCRPCTAYTGPLSFDSTLPEKSFESACLTPDIWNAEQAPIPNLEFLTVPDETVTVSGEETYTFETDKIRGAYPVVSASGPCRIKLETSELPGQETTDEEIIFGKAGEYFSFRMHSAATFRMTVSDADNVTVTLRLKASRYPVTRQGSFSCSDGELNKVYDLCIHTLGICRQTLHLDSTRHQELLACTGDYYIESLMELYAFGDMRLSEFDLIRTADWLSKNNGRMFHTTYSLIWVRMLHDVYLETGHKNLLKKCIPGLRALLDRFESYIGESGVIETPPDYMFVDWTVIDGYSMHHPPRALGQTVLNAFYYEALNKASEIFGYMSLITEQRACRRKAEALYDAFNYEFWDDEMQLYFDGKPGKCGGEVYWNPENPEKKYISKYSNILACLYGLCDDETATEIIERIIFEPNMTDIQPYFMHYLICAVRRLGLFGRYGMKLLSRWKPMAEECSKGLKEGWIAPEAGYSFDHSHAWGGTIAYQLPSAISGMKILEPGMKKLSFSPCLYGLEYADITIPTFAGNIELHLKQGKEPVITVPDGITVV